PEQLEQLLRRRLGGQRDLTDPVKVEPLRQAGEALALTRDAVDLEASPGGPEADGGVFQQAEQRAELRLLVFPRARLAKQGYAACEPRSERFVRRHRAGQSRGNAHPRQRGGFREGRANGRYSLMFATGPIMRALRAAHLHDAPRGVLLRLACEKIRGLGAPYTSVYAYMLHGDELVLEAFSGRETAHTRIPVGRGVCGTAVATGQDQNVADVAAVGDYLACNVETKSELVVLIRRGRTI